VWGRKRAYVLLLVFFGTGLGYCNATITLIFGGFREPIVIHNNFQNGFARYMDQKTPFKAENKRKSSRRLDPNGPDIGVH